MSETFHEDEGENILERIRSRSAKKPEPAQVNHTFKYSEEVKNELNESAQENDILAKIRARNKARNAPEEVKKCRPSSPLFTSKQMEVKRSEIQVLREEVAALQAQVNEMLAGMKKTETEKKEIVSDYDRAMGIVGVKK